MHFGQFAAFSARGARAPHAANAPAQVSAHENIVGRLLSSDDVVIGLDVPDRMRALEEAAAIFERRHGVSRAAVFRALERREKSGSTALGHGIAVPHARIPGISAPIVLFVRTKSGIDFHARDREAVSVLFVILVPERASDEHLKILATVSEMFSNRAFRERLEAVIEPIAIHRLFSEWRIGEER